MFESSSLIKLHHWFSIRGPYSPLRELSKLPRWLKIIYVWYSNNFKTDKLNCKMEICGL